MVPCRDPHKKENGETAAHASFTDGDVHAWVENSHAFHLTRYVRNHLLADAPPFLLFLLSLGSGFEAGTWAIDFKEDISGAYEEEAGAARLLAFLPFPFCVPAL